MKLMYMVVTALLIFSCNNKNDVPIQELERKVDGIRSDLSDTSATASDKPPSANAEKPKPDQKGEPQKDWTQKIIKTANLGLELKDYHSFNNSLHHSLAAYGAYIAQEQQQENDAQITNEMSIKVPVDQFENLLNMLTGDKKNKVLQKQITSADVTAEYADVRSREETKRQVRAKYQQFMSDAHKIDDVLQLQSEINSITEDIEAAAARTKYLSHQSSYSTINLRYFQVLDASKVNDETTPGFGTKLLQALRSGAYIVGELIVVLISVWPLIIIGLIAWYFIKRSSLLKAQPLTKEKK